MGLNISILAAGLVLAAHTASAQVYKEPARGSALRADLMDALRPLAEAQLGAPVEFVVSQLRVAGDVAFADVNPQRPGGGRIDLSTTPMVIAAGGDWGFEGVSTQALYRREGSQWVVVHMAVGATDVWWANPELCPVFAAVIPEVCP